jgi:hypothetical protein
MHVHTFAFISTHAFIFNDTNTCPDRNIDPQRALICKIHNT